MTKKSESTPAVVRFWAKVDKGGDCWLWTARHNQGGYGNFYPQGKESWLAHRYAYFLEHGEIPAGLCVLHRCDTRACVRPDHLFLGTQLENIADRHAKHRDARQPGVLHPQAKLNPAIALEIQRKVAEGVSSQQVALDFGIGYSTVRRIVKGEHWACPGKCVTPQESEARFKAWEKERVA